MSSESHQSQPSGPHEMFSDPPRGYPDLGPQSLDGIRLLRAPAVPTVVVRTMAVPMSDLAELFDSAFGNVFPVAFGAGLVPAGPAFALYTRMTEGPEMEADLEIGFPLDGPLFEQLDDDPIEVDGLRLVASTLPAANVAVTSYVGPYDGMGEAWGEFLGRISAKGLAPGTPFWETYVTEPTPDTDPATLRTDLYCVVRLPDDAA